MTHNDVLFLVRLLIDFSLVLYASRLGKEWLVASIVVNMVLISVLGAEVVSIFGFTTNTGNAFYASVFLAVHMLTEHHGKREALKSVWVGLGAVVGFIVLSQLTILYATPQSSAFDLAARQLFSTVPRIALASILPYIIVQYLNVSLFDYLHQKNGKKLLWLRDNLCNITGQFIDSALFFSIAFLDVLPGSVLLQAMVTGFVVKVAAGAIGTIFMYLSYSFKKEGHA